MGKTEKRKIIYILIGIVLVIACIVGGIFFVRANQTDEPTLDEIVSDKLGAYRTDLADSLDTLSSNEKVADYLLSWASNKNIKAEKDGNNNVIFSLKATSKDLKNVKPVIVACEYDSSDMLSYLDAVSTALTVAKNAKNHGAFQVLFMPVEKGSMVGAEALSEKYFTNDTNLFFIGKSGTSKVSLTTGGYERLMISDKLKRCEPTHDKAYKISIKNVPSQLPGNKMNALPNPIKTLGNLLANFKSTSLLFELSSFSGGQSADTMPANASMTVVINASDEEKFCSRMDNAIEKFNEKYASDYPDITYTYEEVKLPKKVFTKTETENIVSLMYTAPNGIYYKDDDGTVLALTNIGKISTKNAKLSIEVSSMSCSDELLDEIHDSYQTIAGLCNVKIRSVKSYKIFSGGGASSALLADFEEAFTAFTGDSEMIVEDAVETTPCNVFYEKNSSMGMLYCAVTEKTKEKFAGSIITFLDNGENVN